MQNRPTIVNPLLEIRLKGTQAQMGAQYGEMMAAEGSYRDLLEFYPRMAEAMLLGGLPRRMRKGPARRIAEGLLGLAVKSLLKNRNEEYAARMQAMLAAANLAPDLGRHMLVMDVLQNSIGVLGQVGLLHGHTNRPLVHALGACTSAVVFNSMSADGELMHARNFDFPGVGIWDKSPTIVYCTPDKGLPYGYIGSRGADVPGVTAFNAEGLTVTFHTRFHKDVDFNATGVIDLGHDIIRRSRTIKDVIDIVANCRVASTWGIMVTSAREKNAAVIETTAKKCRVTWATADCHAQTNHYLHDDLGEGEIATSNAWTSYTVDRLRLVNSYYKTLRDKGGATLFDMQRLLGADVEADAPEQQRALGSLIGHVLSVKSVVFKLQSGLLSLSVGEAPTGYGPFYDHRVDWSGAALKRVDVTKEKLTEMPAHYGSGKSAEAYEHFKKGYLLDFEGAPLSGIHQEISEAARLAPQDPSLHFLLGALALEGRDNRAGLDHFALCARIEKSAYRKGQALLWAARSAAALGQKTDAAEYRRELFALDHHNLGEIKQIAARDAARILPQRNFSDIVVNMAVLDAA